MTWAPRGQEPLIVGHYHRFLLDCVRGVSPDVYPRAVAGFLLILRLRFRLSLRSILSQEPEHPRFSSPLVVNAQALSAGLGGRGVAAALAALCLNHKHFGGGLPDLLLMRAVRTAPAPETHVDGLVPGGDGRNTSPHAEVSTVRSWGRRFPCPVPVVEGRPSDSEELARLPSTSFLIAREALCLLVSILVYSSAGVVCGPRLVIRHEMKHAVDVLPFLCLQDWSSELSASSGPDWVVGDTTRVSCVS